VIEVPAAAGSDGVDPLRQVQAAATFTAPSGRRHTAPGFWDGGLTWRARFAPDETGRWQYTVTAAVQADQCQEEARAAQTSGSFECVPYTGDNPFYCHGPVRMAPDRRRFVHADGTPWFYLADTVWNGPVLATPDEWDEYVRTRRAQGLTAAQYVTTQWRTAPDGGPDGPAYWGGGTGGTLERVNPGFFRRLDARLDALVDAGLAGVPVLLWAIRGGENKEANPGNVLSVEDCALLARYQIARWHAHPVLWILNGDGKYVGEEAERWRRIGRAVFAGWDPAARPPAMTHPGGQTWVGGEFKDEPWLDVVGYQSGHGDDERAWRWIVAGPPATEWRGVTGKAVVNLESPYEDHVSYQSKQRHPASHVRRANYWSLMVTPTAGVTYGGHGVWGWDDGTAPPVAHPNTGVPKHWREALHLPGAAQMRHLRDAFAALPWWTLEPAQDLIRDQPGQADVLRYVTAARTAGGEAAILYLAAGGELALDLASLAGNLVATWVNPRDGTWVAGGPVENGAVTVRAPDGEDWVLLLAAA
jgi:hypothetical protein